MWIIIGVLITLTAVVVLPRVRRWGGGTNASELGSMSAQWLAEYRASHPW